MKKLAVGDSPVGHLLRFMNEMESDPLELSGLAKMLSNLKSRLPYELRQGEDAVDLDSPKQMRAIAPEARQLLLPHLLSKGVDL